MENEPIGFIASVSKITTVAEGGSRIVLDVPETEMVSTMALMPSVRKFCFKVEMTALEK